MEPRLGRVSQVSPLRVTLNGDTTDTAAVPLSSFAGAVVGSTEVLVLMVENRRFALRVL